MENKECYRILLGVGEYFCENLVFQLRRVKGRRKKMAEWGRGFSSRYRIFKGLELKGWYILGIEKNV